MSHKPEATQIFLVTGFLGAGKTTFLKHRLGRADGRIGVLVNDFGKINFDGLAIRKAGQQMVELTNGSIFCSCLKDQFIDGLVDLIRLGLDRIYIESSGLADPSEMDRILEVVRFRAAGAPFCFKGTICLVDGLYFLRTLPKMLSVERQVRHSHLILINKCDLIDDLHRDLIHQKLSELNPRAKVLETVKAEIPEEDLDFLIFDTGSEETTNTVTTRNKSLVLHFLHDPDEAPFREFLAAVSTHFYRIKGRVRLNGHPARVDLVNQQILIERGTDPDDPGEINQLVCLTSQGMESVSHLALMADRHIPGSFRLEMS